MRPPPKHAIADRSAPVAGLDEPDILVRMGFTGNPLRWLYPALRIGIHGALFVAAWQLATFSNPLPALLFAGINLLLLLRYLQGLLAIDRSTFRFFPDHLEIDRRVPGARRETRRHRYERVGHMELVSMTLVRLFLQPDSGPVHTVSMTIGAQSGEDLFDAIVDHVHRAAPDHQFSIHEHGHLRYSLDGPAELVPDGLAHDVDTIAVRGPTIQIGEQELELDWPDVRRAAGGPSLLRGFEGRYTLLPSGTVVAIATLAKYRELSVELFDDCRYRIDRQERRIHRDDDPVGRIEETPGEYRVVLDRPAPALVTLLLVLSYIQGRGSLRL